MRKDTQMRTRARAHADIVRGVSTHEVSVLIGEGTPASVGPRGAVFSGTEEESETNFGLLLCRTEDSEEALKGKLLRPPTTD